MFATSWVLQEHNLRQAIHNVLNYPSTRPHNKRSSIQQQFLSLCRLQQLAMPSSLTVVLVSLLFATPAVISWLWLVIVPLKVTKLCPQECWCDVGGYFVNCSNKSLHNIPSIYLTHVQELDLNNNNITSLEKDSFISKGLTELNFLALDRCGLQTIELGAFNGLRNLMSLSMKLNRIVEVTGRTFEEMIVLEYLDLQYNKIEHLDVDVFWGLVNLQRINLKGNEILKLHPDMFVGLPKLERLGLGANGGLHIPTDRPFIYSYSLKILDISFCNVSSVSVETFANVSSLEWLDLGFNNLRSIDINILKSLPKLSTIYFDGNPLQCDCQLKELWQWFQVHDIETGSLEWHTLFREKVSCRLEFDKLQCVQDNISNREEYKQKHKYPDDENKQRYEAIKHILEPLTLFLLIFGTTGNVIIIVIVICNKDMRTVHNMYTLNLAISDMIYLTAEIIGTFVKINYTFVCRPFAFCLRMFLGLLGYSVAVLSIQRYRVTVKPFHVRVLSHSTWRASVATICGMWTVAALFTIPSALSNFMCFRLPVTLRHIAYYKRVVLFELYVFCVIPLLVIAFSYISTARHLFKSSCPISEETKIPQMNARKNAAKIMMGLTVVFSISYVPFHIVWTHFVFNVEREFNLNNVTRFLNWNYNFISYHHIASVLLLINSCLNPVAIFCTSSLFRQHLKCNLTCFFKANSPPTNIERIRRN